MAETAPLRLLDAKGCGARRFQNQNWRALVKQILAHAPKLDLSFRTISPTRSATPTLLREPPLVLNCHTTAPPTCARKITIPTATLETMPVPLRLEQPLALKVVCLILVGLLLINWIMHMTTLSGLRLPRCLFWQLIPASPILLPIWGS
jgi:hypothetical protein